MISRLSLATAITFVAFASTCFAARPNVVFILADDLGYGDVRCMNPERCKIATPQMDRLADEGMHFTDAHTSSSVCTPTRYGILTGRYNWRSRLQSGVLFGFNEPLITPDRLTVAGFLKKHGYHTACIGKWHLGLGLPTTDKNSVRGRNPQNVDWKGRISGGPVDLGFDYYHGISASLDMPPYIFIKNDRFVGEATAIKEFHPNRKGPAHPDLEAVDVLPKIGRQSVQYIQQQSADTPFFMYIALTSPHTPIVPSDEWKGKSELGEYGDFVMHTDAVIGQIVAAVDASGFAENTLIIVTSDNGCSAKPSKADELEKQGHYPSAQFRGYKSDLWDGGHRVPFIVRWPAVVDAGSKCDQTICLTDLMATCAEAAGAKLPETAGEDSVSFLPALRGQPIVSSRKGVIHHSIGGKFAYRQGKWKLLLTKGSGGWTKEKQSDNAEAQLYDMEADPGEQNNLYSSHPEVVDQLLAQLKSDVNRGRSTDGPERSNDVPVRLKSPIAGKTRK
ncbi:sulfatase family protein [Aporhodopirellula aestuarii]|uniref:Arylsulfatase n=1 Tax=Aporhodopirellula aestuarii TaxID=2950107 RepID=A0ABT0TYH5_9BACT|nr:arylsulfatase [Aporhodopirellula aestuarii]MCM2369580.1 arylsulfatase [Aporhodopirellula aestuarii]